MEQIFTSTNIFFLANSLYFISYSVRDILWLRLLAVVAAASTFPYFYFQPAPLYAALFWQSGFLLINLVHGAIIVAERRPVKLTEEQARLHTQVFVTLKARDMLKLINVGEWRTAQPGEILLKEGRAPDNLLLVYSGNVKIKKGESEIARIGDGHFGGEMGFLAGARTSATLEAHTETRYLYWQISKLDFLFQKHPHLKDAMLSILGMDMAGKLRRGNVVVAPQPT